MSNFIKIRIAISDDSVASIINATLVTTEVKSINKIEINRKGTQFWAKKQKQQQNETLMQQMQTNQIVYDGQLKF